MDNSEKLKRLILELPWLSKNKSVTIDQFCKTFSITREQAIKDLTLLTFVGPSQFGGDLVDIQISDEFITVVDNQNHKNSMKFTPEELMVLVSSLNLLLESDRTNLILRNLYDKIIKVFYSDTSEKSIGYEQILETLQHSIDNEDLIHIDYIDGRNFVKQNILIKVISVEESANFKYLKGIDCHDGVTKSYRLDRILRVALSNEKYDKELNVKSQKVSNDLNITAPYWKRNVVEQFNLEEKYLDNRTLEFDLTFYDYNFVKTLIYSLGSLVKIKADSSVKNEILESIKSDIVKFS